MWIIFKVFLKSVTTLLCFLFCSFGWEACGDLGPLASGIRRQSLNHWTTRELPEHLLLNADPIFQDLIPIFTPFGVLDIIL